MDENTAVFQLFAVITAAIITKMPKITIDYEDQYLRHFY